MNKMEYLIGLIFSVIVFCIFMGMFYRLGRIEQLLREMAVHQGAITREQANELKVTNKIKQQTARKTYPGHPKNCMCRDCQKIEKEKVI